MSVPVAFARSVFRLQEALMRRPTLAVLAELERSQHLTPADMATARLARLQHFLQTAQAHSPWHAQRFAAAGLADSIHAGTCSFADLARLPTMDKRDARENVEAIVWRGVPGGVFPYTTGGSSGEPLRFYFGRARQAADAAGRLRARRWWGLPPGCREVYLWGAPVELARTDRIKTLRDRLVNQLLLNAFEMSLPVMDRYLDAIAAWNPHAIYGYASSLALLAEHAETRGRRLKLPALRVVATTGEPLFAHQREVIERFFGVPAAVEYGARDAGLIALESPDGVLLQMSETHHVEVLDAEGQATDEGEAVITSFVSQAQPFIRYRTGDVVRATGRSDPGGRALRVIDTVVGRQTDFVRTPDGRIMHALALIYVLRAVPGVAKFKCIQHALDQLDVQIVTTAGWQASSVETIRHGLQARLGTAMHLGIQCVADIPAEASGKHRYVVSHLAPTHGHPSTPNRHPTAP